MNAGPIVGILLNASHAVRILMNAGLTRDVDECWPQEGF